MFSNLASYIFGSSADAEEPSPASADPGLGTPGHPGTPEDDEWVVIGEARAALTLGSLNDAAPRPSTGSTGSSDPPSDPPSDAEEMAEAEAGPGRAEPEAREGVVLTRTFRRLAVPFGAVAGTASLSEIRGARSAQALKLKESAKQLSGKALHRRNKAVKQPSLSGTKTARNGSAALRASGCVRNLKQC